MIRDPYYRDIDNGLSGSLHEEAFERCAQDLLRQIYPTLAPVRGGRDGGMDGVTADLNEDQIVLVATVGEQVKRNLETSLNSMLESTNACRNIISATSQKLSPEKQKELRAAASSLGFRLVQIYERAGMTDLLYESPKWCKELLGLTGDPPPLSVIPRSGRPTITDVLIGRDEDAQWLTGRTGDRLLLGQPGSGKTFLVSALAKQNGWLFIVTRDLGTIANGIRSQKPTALVVDDAHVDTGFLIDLSRMLKELDAGIPVIAICWPGASDHVKQALNLTNDGVRELRPLTRPEVMSVLESAGLTGPENLVYQILNQAAGRPGLAITLAHVCIKGDENDLEEVMLGDALIRSVRTSFEPLVGPQVIELLSAFAVGGRAGMSMQVVAEYFGHSQADVRLAITRLSAGGVVSDVDRQHLSVQPPELRYGLIRDVFFSGAKSLDIVPLLTHVPYLSESTEILANAMHYGASIPTDLMERLLELANSPAAWEAYAWLGPDQAGLALRRHPELIGSLIDPALQHIPEVAIPRLLDEATGDSRALHSHPDHSLRQIQDWVKNGWPGTGEPMRRRESLVDAAGNWLDAGGDVGVGLHAMSIAMTPAFESHSSDPVLGDRFTLRFGVLPMTEIEKVETLWPRVVCALEKSSAQEWHHVLTLISDWVFPQRHTNRGVPDELHGRMREVAKRMLNDVVNIGHESVGLMHRAVELADELQVTLKFAQDPEFETLFPTIPRNWSEHMERHARSIKHLAERWATEQPRSVVERINQLEEQARTVDEGNRQTLWLADELAQLISNPLEWIESILQTKASGDLVKPFLLRASTIRATDWENAALECLSRDATRFAAASTILLMAEPPERVLQAALQSLQGMSKQVETHCLRRVVPEETLRRLLNHEDDAIASHAAIGVWVADPKGSVPEWLRDDWEPAVLRGNRREYWFGEILKDQPDLGLEFLHKEVRRNRQHWSRHDHATREALISLSTEQRLQLIRELPDDFASSEAVAMLVGSDCEAYQELLSTARLERHHTVPLRGRPNEGNWIARAAIALDAGIDPKTVAASAFPMITTWSGKESEMWQGWIDAFQAIRSDDDERVRRVAEHGIEMTSSSRERALREERAEETYGRP